MNEQVVHGIPGPRKVQAGDLVKLDIGVLRDGMYADGARTFIVGRIPQSWQKAGQRDRARAGARHRTGARR